MKTNEIIKYPRTKHISGSGLQKGDEDLDVVPFWKLKNKTLVVEEKIDGANTGVSFNDDGDLKIQSRGHFLVGKDWPEFDQFKLWTNTFQNELFEILENRYIMYGEWMAAYHSVYYDNLPHFFMEFDIYDKEREVFLDTPSRRVITDACKAVIESVRVIETSSYQTIEELLETLGRSSFISANATIRLIDACNEAGLSEAETDALCKLNEDPIMEGLYVKFEEDGIVKERYKFVRSDFVQTIIDYGKHWTERKTMFNRLSEGRSVIEMR